MATVNTTQYFNQVQERWIEAIERERLIRKAPGFNVIAQKFDIPVSQMDANDITPLWLFPAGAYLIDWRSTPSDWDTDATPAVTYSIITIDSADTAKLTIVSGSTNAQAAAGSDRMISAVAGRYVGNQRCAVKIGTAPDVAAAGTLKVYCAFAVGVINRARRGLYLGDAEA